MSAPAGRPVRVAMWSGPRNISTAMMRAWENRSDTVVVDEPLYAHYLDQTELDHPVRAQVVAAGEPDWERAVAELTTGGTGSADIYYQKHMTHHLLPGRTLDWVLALRNVLLIRNPREVVASYVQSRADVTVDDIGLPQQVALFDVLRAADREPPVIDAADFLRRPELYLRWLCGWLGVGFEGAMLHWPAGPRASDGIWAPHWYAAVQRSTGFEPYRERAVELTGAAAQVAADAQSHYERLSGHRLQL